MKKCISLMLTVLMAAAMVATITTSPSAEADDFIRTSQRCSRYFSSFEQKYDIPDGLVRAVATHESGRWYDPANHRIAWPWAVNARGRGYYFNSKKEAIQAVRDMQKRGIKSIDVGCMQINLKFHPDAFTSLEQAFDPFYNVNYGSQMLVQNRDRFGSWQNAVAHYHSGARVEGAQYASRILTTWQRYSGKGTWRDMGTPSAVAAQPAVVHLVVPSSDDAAARRRSDLLVWPRPTSKPVTAEQAKNDAPRPVARPSLFDVVKEADAASTDQLAQDDTARHQEQKISKVLERFRPAANLTPVVE